MMTPIDRNDEKLVQAALDALHRSTGLEGRLVPVRATKSAASYRPDAAVEFRVDNKKLTFQGECKRIIDRSATLVHVKHQLENLKEPGLLISPYLTAQMAEHCRSIGLNFIDAAGNAYLTAPACTSSSKGRKRQQPQTSKANVPAQTPQRCV